MAGNDTAGMNRAMERLTQAQHRAAEALYKQAGASGGPGAAEGPAGEDSASGGSGSQGDVIDAEVVDEEKQ